MPQADPKSSSGQEQQQTAQTVPYPSPYTQHFEDDTIDLYNLWITLWNMKWLVIAVTVVTTLGSIVYAHFTPSIYKAEALLLPPKSLNFQSMNFLGTEYGDRLVHNSVGISSDDVFNKFIQNLNSRTLQKKFIQEKGLMELLAPNRTSETRVEDIYQLFSQLIKLETENGITSFSIELHDAEIAAQWVNDLTEFTDKKTYTVLVEESKNSIANQIRDIEYLIASKRHMARKRREDQIVRYNEAAKIAETLGIKRRVDATNIIQNTQMNVDIATATTPLYYLGYEALMTEIGILRNRKSDDPFIANLRDLQENLTVLRSVKFDKVNMKTVHIDQAAYAPKYAIKPNRRFIVSLATVVGLFSGILLAFFIEFVHNQRKKHSK